MKEERGNKKKGEKKERRKKRKERRDNIKEKIFCRFFLFVI